MFHGTENGYLGEGDRENSVLMKLLTSRQDNQDHIKILRRACQESNLWLQRGEVLQSRSIDNCQPLQQALYALEP